MTPENKRHSKSYYEITDKVIHEFDQLEESHYSPAEKDFNLSMSPEIVLTCLRSR